MGRAMGSTVTPKLTAPSIRGTYGLLVGVGAAVLAVGLLLPFVVADPIVDQVATATPLPSILGPEGSGTAGPGAAVGAGAGGVAGGPGVTLPGGAPAPGSGATVPGVPGAGGATVEEPRTASDVGITADTITVGIPIPDVAAFGDVEGGASFGGAFGDPETQWRAFVDDLNAHGGVQGRRIEPVFRLYDAIDRDGMRAACIYLTEEVQVFAVLGGFYGDPILCVTEQHQTPLLGQAVGGG